MLERAFAEGKLEAPHIYGDDFGSPDETYISSQFDRPVMIHRYPAAFKAFYMQPDPADPTKALCVDVLAPEGYGEIIGGSQRIDSYELLAERIAEHNLPLSAFQWYLDLRRYGSVPHSGFGMGIERVVKPGSPASTTSAVAKPSFARTLEPHLPVAGPAFRCRGRSGLQPPGDAWCPIHAASSYSGFPLYLGTAT